MHFKHISPIPLYGNWEKGFALDRHIISSNFLGNDEFGHPIYDNTRSLIGECLYLFKYKNAFNKLSKILEYSKPFLDSWNDLSYIDYIVSVPPTTIRNYQPAEEIAIEISKYLNIPFMPNLLEKTSTTQSKDMNRQNKELSGTILMNKKAKQHYNILLVDDLYSTGSTLMECVRVLKTDANIDKVYVLTITKTR